MRAWVMVLLFMGLALSGCNGGDDTEDSVDIPEGATFCSVYNGEYRQALNVSPVADPTAAATVASWAEVLAALAPSEIASAAEDNAQYAKDVAGGVSPSDSVTSGSVAFHDWTEGNC